MASKATAIIISNIQGESDYVSILNRLGFTSLTKMKDKFFEEAINPDYDKVFIGQYKDNLIICAPNLAMKLIDKDTSIAESTLINSFPSSEIFAFVLNNKFNLWGYSLIKNGKKIRTKAGNNEDGIFVDIGEPLAQENELISNSKTDAVGNRTYFLDEFPNEPFTENQIGEKLIFKICSRYFGKSLERTDNPIYSIKLNGYIFINNENEITTTGTYDRKHWWRFW